MKSRLLNAGLLACALLMTLSSCSSDETQTGDSSIGAKSMKIKVSDGMFTSVDDNSAKTRATDDGTATVFSSGDAIGIFAVKSDGTLALTNAKYTYDGTYWLNSDNTDKLPYYGGAKYFAYYPYQESLSSTKYDATQTTAETFFASLINSWTPDTDQGTHAKYTAQDLMVSMATVDVSTGSSSFTMSHQMSMVEMDFNQVHYTYNGANTYRFTFDATSNPLNIAAGKYRLLVNPSAALSITGNNQYNSTDVTKTKGWKISGTTPAASKYKVFKYKDASACLIQTSRQNVYIGDANIGDYLYDDGTTGTSTFGKTIVGIVFSNQLSSAEYNAGYTHGYALALQDAISATTSWGPNTGDTGLPQVSTFSGYYNDITTGYYGTFTKGYNKSNSSYPAWQSANNYDVDISKFTNSGWYSPSMGQWWDVCANLGKVDLASMQISISSTGNLYNGYALLTNINNALTSAGGTGLTSNYYYWSASEYNTTDALSIYFGSSYVCLNNMNKLFGGYDVRAVLAF
ncbi:fimbrillin family protein [Segatella paludivivens]|uniref:fimbrillin family protein n=1 Tax=Segatella paludivivens TaxID=185294 RepID=UPI0003A96338|nr:fimbrillin family protein [Segatella paludivivens]